jgi:hypothetical protein
MKEIWRGIPGFEKTHFVSNLGTVYSDITKKKLALVKDKDGYLRVSIRYNGVRKYLGVHRLVAILFINNPENKPEVNHIDFNPANNIFSNLEWVTDKGNKEHSIRNGRKYGRQKGFKLNRNSTEAKGKIRDKDCY